MDISTKKQFRTEKPCCSESSIDGESNILELDWQPEFRSYGKEQFTAHITKDTETGLLCGIIPGLQGAHSQAESLDELSANLKEVIELCLEEVDLRDIDSSKP